MHDNWEAALFISLQHRARRVLAFTSLQIFGTMVEINMEINLPEKSKVGTEESSQEGSDNTPRLFANHQSLKRIWSVIESDIRR